MVLGRTREERGERLDSGVLHTFGLDGFVRALREEPEYATNGRNGVTLVKSSGLSVVLEAMQGGVELSEHRAPGPITVQVLEGEVRFHTEGEVFRIREGELLALPPGRPHAVEAVRDSAFLITIAPRTRKEESQ
jgi:quercetin dioxygenase-like cupin family protein